MKEIQTHRKNEIRRFSLTKQKGCYVGMQKGIKPLKYSPIQLLNTTKVLM